MLEMARALRSPRPTARDRGGPVVAFQMLFYPVIDDRCETTSMKNGAGLYIWDYQNSLDMWDQYIGKERSNVSPYAAPHRRCSACWNTRWGW